MTSISYGVMRDADANVADTNSIPELLSAVQEKPRNFFIDKGKIKSLLNCFDKDLISADLKWSLFVAACQSYKYDSCLRPFPPMFYKDGSKDINQLVS